MMTTKTNLDKKFYEMSRPCRVMNLNNYKLFLPILVAYLWILPSTVSGATLVQWGESADIVSQNQSFVAKTNTYNSNTPINPVVGPNYYPNNDQKNPIFYGAANINNFSIGIVETSSGGDRIAFAHNIANAESLSAMVMWKSDSFLTSPATITLTQINIGGVRQRPTNISQTEMNLRIIIRKDSDFFISQSQSYSGDKSTKQFDLTQPTNWFAFTPFNSGNISIGIQPVTPSLTNLSEIGYFMTTTNDSGASATIGFDITSFQAIGIPEPSAITMLVVFFTICVISKRIKTESKSIMKVNL